MGLFDWFKKKKVVNQELEITVLSQIKTLIVAEANKLLSENDIPAEYCKYTLEQFKNVVKNIPILFDNNGAFFKYDKKEGYSYQGWERGYCIYGFSSVDSSEFVKKCIAEFLFSEYTPSIYYYKGRYICKKYNRELKCYNYINLLTGKEISNNKKSELDTLKPLISK